MCLHSLTFSKPVSKTKKILKICEQSFLNLKDLIEFLIYFLSTVKAN